MIFLVRAPVADGMFNILFIVVFSKAKQKVASFKGYFAIK